MNSPIILPFLLLALNPRAFADDAQSPATRSRLIHATSASPARIAPKFALPPLPEGVEELKLNDFFKTPVGPRGLEISTKLKVLDGRRVRVLGFMVREEISTCEPTARPLPGKRAIPAWLEASVPGRMLLASAPQSVSIAHYALCDDLPAQTLFITVPDHFGEPIPFTPGPLLLTGTLSVGAKVEHDGRQSIVRLVLDPAPTITTASAVTQSTKPTK